MAAEVITFSEVGQEVQELYLDPSQSQLDHSQSERIMYTDGRDEYSKSRRQFEQRLSKTDEAIQALALITKGSIAIHEHGCPIRAIEVSCTDGFTKRLLITPMLERRNEIDEIVFEMVISAWKDDIAGRRDWHKRILKFKEFPDDFSVQIEMLEKCWTELDKIDRSCLGETK
jgi:hypothetical protein